MMTDAATNVAWVEIDFNRLQNNIQAIRKRVGASTKIMGIVKANAYGHGLHEVSSFLLKKGIDALGVVSLTEGISLRTSGISSPIVLLGVILPEQAELVVKNNLTPTVTSIPVVKALNRLGSRMGRRIKIHIRVDIGLGSVGILPHECISFVKEVVSYEWIQIEGLYTHLASSYDNNPKIIENDISIFNEIIRCLKVKGINIPMIHAASSAAILTLPYTYFDMVRPGISMYGLPAVMHAEDSELEPVMQLKAKIVVLKKFSNGTLMGGYGNRYSLGRDTVIATVPLGYGDGLFLYFLKNGEVLIKGKRAKIIGKPFMDYLMVDVTHIPDVEVGDEVVIFGEQGNERITIEEIAEKTKIGKMNCDCITLLSSRVPRVYRIIDSKILCKVDAEG